jgi:hypothetical protein
METAPDSNPDDERRPLPRCPIDGTDLIYGSSRVGDVVTLGTIAIATSAPRERAAGTRAARSEPAYGTGLPRAPSLHMTRRRRPRRHRLTTEKGERIRHFG